MPQTFDEILTSMLEQLENNPGQVLNRSAKI